MPDDKLLNLNQEKCKDINLYYEDEKGKKQRVSMIKDGYPCDAKKNVISKDLYYKVKNVATGEEKYFTISNQKATGLIGADSIFPLKTEYTVSNEVMQSAAEIYFKTILGEKNVPTIKIKEEVKKGDKNYDLHKGATGSISNPAELQDAANDFCAALNNFVSDSGYFVNVAADNPTHNPPKKPAIGYIS